MISSFAATLVVGEATAEACGCLNPPAVGDDIAVNQASEQIIFEVEDGFVTAHVLIGYVGKPSEFAWIVPVPAVPELSLSPEFGFALLDAASAPEIVVDVKDECPIPDWRCTNARYPDCEPSSVGCGAQEVSVDQFDSISDADPNFDGEGSEPPVDILDRTVIGAYETVVFSAGDVAGTLQWLRDEGFIVNETMAPYIQSYSDANMLFLASKLVPGASTNDIRPLRMRYASEAPMIPLQLTAVAAEPDMTITAYVYADQPYAPLRFPLAQVDAKSISVDSRGRENYPMVLRRAVDEAGGKNFVAEYSGPPVGIDFDRGTGCCDTGPDVCGWGGDGVCSCPANAFDADDCENAEAILEGAQFVEALAEKHSYLTRLTTRMSAEDMTYDPIFVPTKALAAFGRLRLENELSTLLRCEGDIMDTARYEDIREVEDCASMYCGTGTCVVTTSGVGCECGPGTTARRFIDLDGRPSTTCAPDTSPVDLSAGGLELPDPCATVECGVGVGTCLDVGGFPTCQCADGFAGAQAGLEAAPVCEPILARTTSSGADNFSARLADIPVCAPAAPECGVYGWNIPETRFAGKQGVDCYPAPSASDQEPVDGPTCKDLGRRERGSGCSTESSTNGLTSVGLMGIVFFLAFRRRRDSV